MVQYCKFEYFVGNILEIKKERRGKKLDLRSIFEYFRANALAIWATEELSTQIFLWTQVKYI